MSAAASQTIEVFVLADQSNMEGKAQLPLMEHVATQPASAERLAHLRRVDGWGVRDDVRIDSLGREGPLTVGYGSRNRVGVELDFGHVVGDHLEALVLLIKAAWGGRSL
ncbi:MAG: sialate O-acetylesterase [Planctomycetota bacterium]